MKPAKPVFQSVVDLGLRDVGVKNQPRRLAAHVGRWMPAIAVLAILFVVVACAVLRRSGAGDGVVALFALLWTMTVVRLAVKLAAGAPVAVIRVTAGGQNQLVWPAHAAAVLVALAALVLGQLLLLPAAVLSALMALMVWRGGRRIPELLQRLGEQREPGEAVLGDGLGTAAGERRQDALRVVAATDRRLLLVSASGIVEVAYAQIRGFAIEWKVAGRVGSLTLSAEGVPVIASMNPPNLVSIARALRANGVQPSDPDALAEAEGAWEEALQRRRPHGPLLDRAGMSRPAFDHGLWLLLGLAAAVFYLNSFGVGLGNMRDAIPALLAAPVLCAICGYVSRTRSSLAYLAPLNLLVLPTFFFADPGDVLAFMIALSALAAVGLAAGAALRGDSDSPAAEGPPRGGLRAALSGLSLIRISTVLLAVMGVTVTAASAAGVEMTTLWRTVQDETALRLPADGRSNLSGGGASLRYTAASGLRELVTDEHLEAGPDDGARWELRTAPSAGFNAITLAHYIFDDPRLDDAAAVAEFVKGKDEEHAKLAGGRVGHTRRVVDGRTGYVWKHRTANGYWYFTAWFPQPVHTVRLECIARSREERFRRLCAEAMSSLAFAD